MFKNIGKKIKKLAAVMCIIGIVLWVIVGIGLMLSNMTTASLIGASASAGTVIASIIAGVLVMVIGSLLSWISSWLIYGFGELVDNSCKIANKTEAQD